MRRPKNSVSAVSEFSCSAAAVWQTLTREQSYKNWFGYPKTEDLVFVDPSFSVGGKLNFKGLSTSVITSFRPERELTFSDSDYQVSFFLDPIEEGVSVTLTLDTYSEGRYEEIDKRRFCTETLRALKNSIDIGGRTATTEQLRPVPTRAGSGVARFFRRVFVGYQSPISKTTGGSATREAHTPSVDNTDAGVTISRSALLSAILLILLFFASISVALSFERSDIVPSSGLSLLESDRVNKYHSTLIKIGDKKQDLELMLSCQGLRRNVSSTVEFLYNSLSQTDKLANEQIFVLYDAYGDVRKFAYVDNQQAQKDLYRDPLDGKLTVGREYYELLDFNVSLSSSMTIYEVEEVVGVPVSGYICDRNGSVTIFFGKFLYGDDIFSTNYRSQIMISLDPSNGKTSVAFYKQIDDPESPFPLDELSKTLKRQYADFDEYLSDRFAFERSFLLLHASEDQLPVLVGARGRLITPSGDEETEDSPLTTDLPEDETAPQDIFETYLYSVRSAFDADGSSTRHQYLINYENGIAKSVIYTNGKLISYSSNTLSHLEPNSFYVGMRYERAAEIVGVLPTSVYVDDEVFILYYGNAVLNDRSEDNISYELALTFSQENALLKEYSFFEKQVDEDSD